MDDHQITVTLARRSIEGIIAQGKLAQEKAIGGNTCALLTDDGSRCAVGQLIAPEHYDADLEGMPDPAFSPAFEVRRAIAASNPDLALDPDDHNKPYWAAVSALQDAHDSLSDTEDVEGFIARARDELAELGFPIEETPA